MIDGQIVEYCQKHCFTIENYMRGKKSVILSLRKNNKKYILKKLFVAEDEDIEHKFDMEIGIYESIKKIKNNNILLPSLVDVVRKAHFYICHRIEGPSLHQKISSFFDNKSQIMDIHKKLFDWLREFYVYFQKNDGLDFGSLMNHGPYTRKMIEILGKNGFDPLMGRLFDEKKIFISKVHGDLTPWNIILDSEKQLYLLDWGNSGFDYPAHDVTRFMLQMQKKIILRKVRKELVTLFWESFGYLFGEDLNIFQKILNFQYHYSKKNLELKSSSFAFNLFLVKFIRRCLLYISYKALLINMKRCVNRDTHT